MIEDDRVGAPKFSVMDVDGVLTDPQHRLHLIRRPPQQKDWDTFYGLVSQDPPATTGLDPARSLALRTRMVYLTGRREGCRADTLDWFDRHGVPAGQLLMRRDHDYRPASVLKLENLAGVAPANVLLVVDDDPRVCDALEAAGYSVLQAAWARAEGA